MADGGRAIPASPELANADFDALLPGNLAIAANGNAITAVALTRARQRQQMVLAAEVHRATPLEVASTNVYVCALEREAVRRSGGMYLLSRRFRCSLQYKGP